MIRKIYPIILLIMGSFMLFGALNAQMSTYYSFTQVASPWSPIWGTYVTGAMTDEGISSQIDIGFDFPYAGSTYSQVKVSSNGWIGLGTNLTQPYYGNGLATLNIRPLLAPLWDDLDISVGAVQYDIYGLEPHRVFIIQFLAVKWDYNGSNEYNFMVRMHQTGQVDFIYGPHTGASHNPSATIGINMSPGGPGYYYSVNPGIPAHAFSNSEYNSIQSAPADGVMYIFAPRSFVNQDISAVNLTGNIAPMQNTETTFQATFGNAGTGFITASTGTGYLMRGEEVLATVNLPSISPSGFVTVPISWIPDITGYTQLYLKASLANDPDSLNDKSYTFPIDVLPYVANDDQTSPAAIELISCYPNPFAEATTISYSLKTATPVKIEIFNLKGQKINTLLNATKSPGSHTVIWNGTDDNHHAVSKGIYLCKVSSNKDEEIKKLILIR